MPGTMSFRHINRRFLIFYFTVEIDKLARDLMLRNNKGNLHMSNRGAEAVERLAVQP